VKKLLLFTDGSVNADTNTGYGAFLAISDDMDFAKAKNSDVQLKRFEETSSVKLEIQTLLWALNKVKQQNLNLTIFTDSQNITLLQGRRIRLETNDYHSKSGKRIKNFELYRQFYQLTDELECEFVKIKGHKKTNKKDNYDKLFALVDRASRSAVRNEKAKSNE
jgi:ribonuclease HI